MPFTQTCPVAPFQARVAEVEGELAAARGGAQSAAQALLAEREAATRVEREHEIVVARIETALAQVRTALAQATAREAAALARAAMADRRRAGATARFHPGVRNRRYASLSGSSS
jgi:hypothetical protein